MRCSDIGEASSGGGTERAIVGGDRVGCSVRRALVGAVGREWRDEEHDRGGGVQPHGGGPDLVARFGLPRIHPGGGSSRSLLVRQHPVPRGHRVVPASIPVT